MSELYELQNKIFNIVKANIDKDDIVSAQLETDLSELGMDSITFIRIAVAIEEEFGIEVPDRYLLMTEMNTIDKMSAIVSTVLGNAQIIQKSNK